MRSSLNTFLTVGFVMLASTLATGQVVKPDSTSKWKKTLKAGLNINQAALSSNWKAGGINSFGFNALFNFKAGYKSDKTSFDYEIDLLYGMVSNEGQGYRKTLDRIFLDIKFGHALSKHWDAVVAANTISQFASGYKYEKDVNGVEQSLLQSESLAPTFQTVSIGVEYDVEHFKIRISPFAPRFTFLSNNDGRYIAVDPATPYGVPVGTEIRYEWAAFQLLSEFDKDIAKNVNLKARYLVFANYKTLEANMIDHRLDISITGKVNRFLNVNLGSIMVYDFDQDHSPQYSQAFSLGFLYTFQNYEEKK